MENLKQKLEQIERHFGSAHRAAEEAGVTATSWSRWKREDKSRIIPTGPRLRVIELLYEQVRENE